MTLCDTFLTSNNDIILVRYPAATVLLDLTASESCIERVSTLIMQKNLIPLVLRELRQSLERKIPKNCPNRVYFHRYRDLMMGIILNVTCNVESEQVTQHILSEGVMKALTVILVDSRHDWPTNGAALALLQYSHIALSSADIYLKLEDAKALDVMTQFIGECRNKETKRYLYEAVTLIEMARQKMQGISTIYIKQLFAASA